VVYGPGLAAQARTDDAGTARIAWFGGPIESVQALYIKPDANYWERFIAAPRLNARVRGNDAGVNTVKLRPLSEMFANFPRERLVGWGQRLMHLNLLGNRFTGSGARIGIIDSGCDNSHPLLRHITRGQDIIG